MWGAQGGNVIYPKSESSESESIRGGGLGGYAVGHEKLVGNKNLYVCVGKQGNNSISGSSSGSKGGYNGGGNGGAHIPSIEDRPSGAGGGGCTHIASSDHGELRYYNNSNFLNDVLLVAGGGGGAAGMGRSDGVGGGEKGGSATTHGTPSNWRIHVSPITYQGGSADSYYQIGLGESAPDKTYGGDFGDEGGGGGGGGYYGGKACNLLGGDGSSCNGTGGSGYVNTSILTNASTIAGINSFPSPITSGDETGHTGSGWAKLTWQYK